MRLTATYRVQLHADYTFSDTEQIVPYLADLGVSHLYLSPILSAVPGSLHGYDVIDHASVAAELGGRDGLESLARVAHDAGLGVVVDIVPNHMALVAPQWTNQPLWAMLREGQDAVTARWFDVDWAALDGRFGLPVLGESLEEELAAGALVLDTGRPDEGPAAGQPVIRYHEHVLPVAPGTADGTAEGDVAAVLARQHYLLAGWREAGEVLNYRRFFEVDSLIGVRVELPEVFEQTHRVLLELHHAGLVDGFRIDHPDGLADPEGYLEQLSAACRPGTPVWVEKILEGSERLPEQWRCSGTTGYDANAALQVALVDPETTEAVSAAWLRAGGDPDLGVVIAESKREAVEELLQPEVTRLLRLSCAVLPEHDPVALREAMVELLVAVEVYRAYVRPGHPPQPGADRPLLEAVERAIAALPSREQVITDLAGVLGDPDHAAHDPAAARDLAVRFQQTTGPVMAKGIEDTAFYRWHRLVALNEVGADPAHGVDPEASLLHDWARHQAEHWPQGMTTLSTHDTKRSEDVRARILAVSGDAASWDRCTDAFVAAALRHRVDRPTAHLLWQTLVGAGRIGERRLLAYLEKAMREAKDRTSWVDTAEGYEDRVTALAREALAPGDLADAVAEAVSRSEDAIRALTLGQKLLQLTLPGVPDTYQGGAGLDLSLVDPDNRRPVDYRDRIDRLAHLDSGGPVRDLADAVVLVTSRALRLRAEQPDLFGPGSGYAVVPGNEHLLGFVRGDLRVGGGVAALATRAPHGLARRGGWGQRRALIVPGQWRDVLSGTRHQVGQDGLRCAELFAELPVALLVKGEAR